MATKNKKSSSSSNSTHTEKWTIAKIFDLFAYIALFAIGVAMCLSFIPAIANPMQKVGMALAYLVTIYVSFNWTRRKRNVAWLVLWIIFAVLVFVTYVASLF